MGLLIYFFGLHSHFRKFSTYICTRLKTAVQMRICYTEKILTKNREIEYWSIFLFKLRISIQKDLKNLSYSITMGNNNKLKIKNDNKK